MVKILEYPHYINRNEPYYELFLKAFGPIVVGKKKWRKNCTSKELSKFFTSSDEAFLHLCYHTYYKKWMSMVYKNGNNNNEYYNKIIGNNN